MKIFALSKPTTNRHASFMHTNVSITLFLLTFLLTISINCINCTPSITTLPPKKKKNSISEKIVFIYDSIEIPASNSLLRTNLGGGKVGNSSRKRSVDVRHFEADWAFFFFFKSRTRWLHARAPAAIDQPRKLLPVQIFFPPFLPLVSSSHVQRSRPAFPIHHSSALREASSPLLPSPCWEEVDAAGIPNCGFVFPRRYLLFHAGVHRMNEEGKLEGWTDDDLPLSPLFLPFFLPFSSPFSSFLFYFPFLHPLLPRIPFEWARFVFHRSPMMNGYWNKVMPMLMLRNVSKLGEYDFLPLRRVNISFENTFVFTPWSIKCSRKSYYCFPIDTFRQV